MTPKFKDPAYQSYLLITYSTLLLFKNIKIKTTQGTLHSYVELFVHNIADKTLIILSFLRSLEGMLDLVNAIKKKH